MSSNFKEMMKKAIEDRQESSLLTEAQFIDDIALLYRIKKPKAEFPCRDINILFKRYGINGYEKHTLKAIGDFYGLKPERPRQICAKIMRIIKCTNITRKWVETGRPLDEIIRQTDQLFWRIESEF